MEGFRPCGACRAYVPITAGCEHWTPERTEKRKTGRRDTATERMRRYRARRKAERGK